MKPIPKRTGNEGEDIGEIAGEETEALTEEAILEGEEKWIQAHEFK